MNETPFIKPTETELDILSILWKHGKVKVGLVHEELNKLRPHKKVVYTTTLKLMQLMLEKGLAKRDSSKRAHIYSATVNQEEAQGYYLNKMLDTVFSGSASSLILNALGNDEISQEQLDRIREVIDEKSSSPKSAGLSSFFFGKK